MLKYGMNFFDTADGSLQSASERNLGAALKDQRDKTLVSAKATLATMVAIL